MEIRLAGYRGQAELAYQRLTYSAEECEDKWDFLITLFSFLFSYVIFPLLLFFFFFFFFLFSS